MSPSALAIYAAPAFALAVPTIPVYVLLPAFYAETLGLGLAATGAAVLFLLAAFSSDSPRPSARLHFALRRALPQIAITAVYLLLRLELFGPSRVPLGGFYATSWGWHLLINHVRYALVVLDQQPVKLWLAALLLVLPAILLRVRGDRARLGWLLGRDALFLSWAAVVMLPFVGFASASMGTTSNTVPTRMRPPPLIGRHPTPTCGAVHGVTEGQHRTST